MLGAGALGQPRGMVQGGRREEGPGWGTCVYLWRIHVDIWQNQYNIVKLKNKIKKKKRKKNQAITEMIKIDIFLFRITKGKIFVWIPQADSYFLRQAVATTSLVRVKFLLIRY